MCVGPLWRRRFSAPPPAAADSRRCLPRLRAPGSPAFGSPLPTGGRREPSGRRRRLFARCATRHLVRSRARQRPCVAAVTQTSTATKSSARRAMSSATSALGRVVARGGRRRGARHGRLLAPTHAARARAVICARRIQFFLLIATPHSSSTAALLSLANMSSVDSLPVLPVQLRPRPRNRRRQELRQPPRRALCAQRNLWHAHRAHRRVQHRPSGAAQLGDRAHALQAARAADAAQRRRARGVRAARRRAAAPPRRRAPLRLRARVDGALPPRQDQATRRPRVATPAPRRNCATLRRSTPAGGCSPPRGRARLRCSPSRSWWRPAAPPCCRARWSTGASRRWRRLSTTKAGVL